MNWRLYQRVFELTAVAAMMVGIVLMWKRSDSQHFLIYLGFALLATGKLIEAVNLDDPYFKIVKMSACVSIYLLILLNFFYQVRSIAYVLIPLLIYYLLHYRLMFQQRKS